MEFRGETFSVNVQMCKFMYTYCLVKIILSLYVRHVSQCKKQGNTQIQYGLKK